jgi:hypothetical protein
LYVDSTGAIYSSGGSRHGSAFQLVPSRVSYSEKVLCTFKGPPDGSSLDGPLIEDNSGALYGVTDAGGYSTCYAQSQACGAVFKITHESIGALSQLGKVRRPNSARHIPAVSSQSRLDHASAGAIVSVIVCGGSAPKAFLTAYSVCTAALRSVVDKTYVPFVDHSKAADRTGCGSPSSRRPSMPTKRWAVAIRRASAEGGRSPPAISGLSCAQVRPAVNPGFQGMTAFAVGCGKITVVAPIAGSLAMI